MAKVSKINIGVVERIVDMKLTNNKAALKEIVMRKGAGKGVGRIALSKMTAMAEELKDLIIAAANSSIPSSAASVIDIISSIKTGGIVDNGNGIYTIDLTISGDMTRPSLNPGNAGVYNIVTLFIRGYENTSGSRPFGEYKGHKQFAAWSMPGHEFLSGAIAEFNAKYAGVAEAIAVGEYQ